MRTHVMLLLLFTSALCSADQTTPRSTHSDSLAVGDFKTLGNFYNNNIHDVMSQTWRDTGIENWRKATHSVFCSSDLVQLNRFSIKYDSFPVFMANMWQRTEDSALPESISSSVSFTDMGHTFYKSYMEVYVMGALNTHKFLAAEHPQVLETLCNRLDISDVKLEANVVGNNHLYNEGLDLVQVTPEARFQLDINAHLGLSSTLIFLRSSKPRFSYLTAAGMARHFRETEKYKEIQNIYMDTQPVLGPGGYVEHFIALYEELNGAMSRQLDEQNWRVINYVWDAQRNAYYRGVSSTLNRIKKHHPDAYTEIEAKLADMLQMLEGSMKSAA